eukprot:jgi/Mesvir1/24523/Mv21864-RA.2
MADIDDLREERGRSADGRRRVERGRSPDDRDRRPEKRYSDDRAPRRERDLKRRAPSPSPPRRAPYPRKASPPPPAKRHRREEPAFDRRGRPDAREDVILIKKGPRGWGGEPPEKEARPGRRPEPVPVVLSYKQYITRLDDDVTPDEALKKYQVYRQEQARALRRSYFLAHKDEEGLRAMYHPLECEKEAERRSREAQAAAAQFSSQYANQAVDPLSDSREATSVTAERDNGGADASMNGSDDEGGRRRPSAAKHWTLPWPETEGVPGRVEHDLTYCAALARKMDKAYHVDDNPLLIQLGIVRRVEEEGGEPRLVDGDGVLTGLAATMEPARRLLFLLAYLWRVHRVDYFGLPVEGGKGRGREGMEEGGQNGHGGRSLAQLDAKWQQVLEAPDRLRAFIGKEKVEEYVTAQTDALIHEAGENKYACGVEDCPKMFHGPVFVKKHLMLKHAAVVEAFRKAKQEQLYEENFLSDPNAVSDEEVLASVEQQQRMSGGEGMRGDGGPHSDADHSPPPGRRGPPDRDRDRRGPPGRDFERELRAGPLGDRLSFQGPPGGFPVPFDGPGRFEGPPPPMGGPGPMDRPGGPMGRGPPMGPMFVPVPGAG